MLQYIRAQPEDICRRLVYADWLEELGETQAEYIRIQCQLFREPRTLQSTSLRARAALLWRVGQSRWDSRLWRLLQQTSLRDHHGSKLRNWSYHRGCVESVTMSADAVADHLEAALMIGPVISLKVCKEKVNSSHQRFRLVEAFERTEALKGISHLDLTGLDRGLKKILRLLQVENLCSVKSIRFSAMSFQSAASYYRSTRDHILEGNAKRIFESSRLQRVEFQTVGHIAVFERSDFVANPETSSSGDVF